jgi:hypothetical protein
VEGCSTETLAVADPNTFTVAACMTEYGDELTATAGASDLRVTQAGPCPGVTGSRFTIRLHDPSR